MERGHYLLHHLTLKGFLGTQNNDEQQLGWRLNFHRHTLSDPVQCSGGQVDSQQGAHSEEYCIIGTTRLEILSVGLQS